jgi:LPXTG-motif cell wall-anchored protein
MKNYKVFIANLIVSFIAVSTVTVLFPQNVSANSDADCEENYGGGETCIVNKRFKIEKWVRLEGEKKDKSCKEWNDEVTIDLTDNDEKDKYVEFCIRVKNMSDEYGDLDFDDMKMKDSLPEELKRTGGDGLTEEWDNFDPGETKEFRIKVRIDEDELDRDGEYEKCVVNKASVYWKGNKEGTDTATVCWKDYKKEIKELPKTGSESALAGIAGLAVASLGFVATKIKATFNK